jgi:hypothetical protein
MNCNRKKSKLAFCYSKNKPNKFYMLIVLFLSDSNAF